MKLEKPFYVASNSMIEDPRNWRKATVEEAIQHASRVMEKDKELDEVWIVKVVKVVRRIPPPVTAEDVE